jgi:hypothetical protein
MGSRGTVPSRVNVDPNPAGVFFEGKRLFQNPIVSTPFPDTIRVACPFLRAESFSYP